MEWHHQGRGRRAYLGQSGLAITINFPTCIEGVFFCLLLLVLEQGLGFSPNKKPRHFLNAVLPFLPSQFFEVSSTVCTSETIQKKMVDRQVVCVHLGKLLKGCVMSCRQDRSQQQHLKPGHYTMIAVGCQRKWTLGVNNSQVGHKVCRYHSPMTNDLHFTVNPQSHLPQDLKGISSESSRDAQDVPGAGYVCIYSCIFITFLSCIFFRELRAVYMDLPSPCPKVTQSQ